MLVFTGMVFPNHAEYTVSAMLSHSTQTKMNTTMPEQPTEKDLRKWHRRFAVEANKRASTLSEKPVLTTKQKHVRK